MKLDAGRFGLAGGITIGFIYGAFTITLKLWPTTILKLIGSMHFISGLEMFAPFINITLFNIIFGMIGHCIFVFLLFWTIATIYNKLQKE